MLNVEKLLEVKKAILEEPRRINMAEGIVTAKRASLRLGHEQAPPCSTVGCIAGWTVLLNTPKEDWPTLFAFQEEQVSWIDVERRAQAILGNDNRSKLFFPEKWPEEFSLDELTPSTKEYAQVIANYIDYYIKENSNA